jgi:hypothetical protein
MFSKQEYSQAESDNMRKGVAYLILTVFCIVMLTVLYYFKENYLASKLSANSVSKASISDLIDVESYEKLRDGAGDSNTDGLSNWREVIYSASGDSLLAASSTLSRDETNIVVSSSTNLTEILSRDLYVAAQYKKNDNSLNATSLVNAIGQNYSELLKPKEAITLNVIASPSFEEYRAYGEIMALFFKVTFIRGIEDELSEMKEDSATFDKTKAKRKIINGTCEYAKTMSGIPIVMQNSHLNYINNCSHYVAILDSFINNKDDPYKSVIGLGDHPKVTIDIYNNYKEYKNEFAKAKYKYTAKEQGSLYNILD